KKTKTCRKYSSKNTKKIGIRRGLQRYRCNYCNSKFQSARRPKKLLEILFYKYLFRHQTYADLAIEYDKTKKWVYTQIHNYEAAKKEHKPRAVTLVCDTTFYGKRKDKLATVVFYDTIDDEVLLWKHVDSEKSKYYKEMLQELLSLGYRVNAITIDGKRCLNTVFKEYPIQMCHFHQKKIIDRYITKNPKLEASIELQKILNRITKTTETRLKKMIYPVNLGEFTSSFSIIYSN
uniref:IS256 family transposase, variant Zn-binding type n=1 Tax=Francisella sp. XLW-1 TaxID=2610887 RepID=UPI001CD14401